LKLVLCDPDRVLLGLEGVFDLNVILLSAEDDADGGVVVRPALRIVEQVQVESILPAYPGSNGPTFNSKATSALRKR
jgi:hypothetical protein